MSPAPPAVIAARDLAKTYPNGALGLAGVSVTVWAGEVVAVLGPSGSGKTTLLRLCNGAIRPQAGDLVVLGTPVPTARGPGLRRLRRRVALVYQNHNLVGSLSVLQNVLLGRLGATHLARALKRAFWPDRAIEEEVYGLLGSLGIADKLYTRVEDLSGGQQQRVAIARALIQRPDLLLADEPVASVDAETATVILDLLREVARARDMTVLVSLHQRQYVERYCDRILEFASGKLVRDQAVAARPVAVERRA